MRSLTLNLLIVALFSYCCLVPRVGFAANNLLISGKLDNQSSHPWRSMMLTSYKIDFAQALNQDVQNNIDRYRAPAKGSFIVTLPSDLTQPTPLYLYVQLPYQRYPIICTFTIQATGNNTATMKLVSKDDYAAPVKCNFSGDVNDNTAVITVTNNPNWAPSK